MNHKLQGPISIVKPRFRDFDVQGILNSSVYLEIVSEVRLEQMENYYKLPMAEYLRQGQTWVISNYEITFKRPIKYPSIFHVNTKVEEIIGSAAKITFKFLSDKSDEEYAFGSVVYNLFDLVNKKTTQILKAHADIFISEIS